MERGMEMQRGQATSTCCMYMQDGHEAWKSSVDIHKGHVAFCIADLKSFCKSANLAVERKRYVGLPLMQIRFSYTFF
jgi:hypothetical protein